MNITPQEPAEPPAELLRRITDTHIAQETAAKVHDQAIRDAAAAGHPLTAIARTLGVSNRKRIYAVLADAPPPEPGPPALPPVIFMRGAGQPAEIWHAIETAMYTRGLATIRDRQQAWHLARGHTPVILLDFSAGKPGIIGQIQARYKTIGSIDNRQPELPLIHPETATHFPTHNIDPDHLARTTTTHLIPLGSSVAP